MASGPKTQYRWSFLFCLLVLTFAGVAELRADIQATPNFLFLSNPRKSAPLTITNVGDDEREVWIEIRFGYETSDDTGKLFIFIDSNNTSPLTNSASGWIIGYPRRFILAAGESQTIRVVASPPAGLPEGEYWARVMVTSKTRKPAQASTAPVVSGAKPGINVLYRLSVPFHYRVGQLRTGLTVDTVQTSIGDTNVVVGMHLTKTGNAAFWGSRSVRIVDKSGKTVATLTHNTGVYTTLKTFDRFKRSLFAPGEYNVEIEFVTEKRSDINKQLLVKSSPIRASALLIVP